jgi:hypothetical protein
MERRTMPITDSQSVRVLSQRLKRSGGCRKITGTMSVACVNETLDLIEASDDAWLLHRCAQRETAWMLESAMWRGWFLRRVSQLRPQDDRLRWNKYLRRAYRWAKKRWPRIVQQFDFRAALGSTWMLTMSPKLERAPDINLEKLERMQDIDREKLGHEIGYASALWDSRDRLVEGPARTLALNRVSSGVNEYVDRQSRAKLGAITVRVSAQKGMGVIGARRVAMMIKKSRAGVLIVPNADRLGRLACEAATDAFALCGVGVRLLAPGEGAAHCPNLDHDDGALLDGLIVAPRRLAGDFGVRVCDGVLMRRPQGVRPTLMAVAGCGRPLPLLAFIAAATFPHDVVLLRAGTDDRPAFVQRGKKRFSADLGGLARAGGGGAALRLARRAKARAAAATLDAGSAELERRIRDPSPARPRGRPREERSANIPRCFGGRGMGRGVADFVM